MNKQIILISVVIISLFGLIMITSSSYIWAEYKFDDPYKYFKNQLLFLILGIILMIIISKINYRIYYEKANLLLLIGVILLILVLIPGIGMIRNGSRSWFGIGSFGIQPSEAAKLIIIIFTAKYLTNNQEKTNILPILGVATLIFGLIMLQPDFGTGVILMMIVIGMIFISGANLSIFVKMGIIGLVGIVILIIMAPYRLERILSFLNPWQDPLGSGFQIIQSLYAIGPGGLFGFGFGNSRQKHFYLPEPQTDFIFSIISEEFGFMGCLLVVGLFFLIIITGFRIARNCHDLFGKYLAFGITFWIAFQAILNLMVVIGLIPVTGVTLPFLSYGGSSLLILMISMGILINISGYENKEL
ncbi:MAG: putative lipid II flippase FtsW [Bacilli bacterium]|nr:putative lipid II flippase FtsW [Bacilli bacterium]MDD4808843.1 putative lipid II flippase FtsW [Bacilli bacterium]